MSVEHEPAADAGASVETLGRELGEAIAELPEYEAFEDAREAVRADEEVQQLIQSFEQTRREFMLARQVGEADEAALEEVQAAQQQLHEQPVMTEFLDAQEALVDRLEAINEAISAPLAIDFGGEAGGCCQD